MAPPRGSAAPIGDGPFHVKGVIYQAARAFFEQRVPGGYAATRDALEDHAMSAFLDQAFLTGGWYDAVPMHALIHAAARVCGVPHAQMQREGGQFQAERDLRGIYKMIVSMASPEMVAERLPGLSMRYFDFGAADGRMIADNTLESHRWGIPMLFADWFTYSAVGFIPVALGIAGAKNVRVRHASTREGEAHGVPTVRIRFEITWE